MHSFKGYGCMKKRYALLSSLGLILILIFITLLIKDLFFDVKVTLADHSKANISNSNNKLINKETLDINTVMPCGITMKSNYNEILKLYGNPMKIKRITDKDIILLKGYFINLIYKDKEIILNCYDKNPYNLKKNNEITRIDYYGGGTTLNGKITIGDTYESIYNRFKTNNNTAVYLSDIKVKLNEFKDYKTYPYYSKLLYISTTNPNEALTTMVLLFNNHNLLKNIVYIHPTAG
jgi:hypothetical protein